MKNIFLIVALLFSSSAYAGKHQTSIEVPPDAQLIETTYAKSDCYTSSYRATLTSVCIEQVSKLKQDQIKAQVQSQLESKCSEVITNTNILDSKDSFRVGHFYNNFSTYPKCYEKKIILTTYCKPRPFSEMALMSLFKKCQESPQQECFDPQILARLDQVKPIQYKYNTSGSCK